MGEPHFTAVADKNPGSGGVYDDGQFGPQSTSGSCLETEDELHLAARLGQALLEQNHQLQERLQQLQTIVETTTTENSWLREQLSVVRESCNAVEEERYRLEGGVGELESKVTTLRHRSAESDLRIEELQQNVSQLNTICDDKQAEISVLRNRYETLLLRWKACGDDDGDDEEQKRNCALNLQRSSSCLNCQKLSMKLAELRESELLWNDEKENLRGTVDEMNGKLLTLQHQLISSRQEVSDLSTAEPQLQVSSFLSCEELEDLEGASSNCAATEDGEGSFVFTLNERMAANDVDDVSLFDEMDSCYEALQREFDEFRQHCTCQPDVSNADRDNADRDQGGGQPNSSPPPDGLKSDRPLTGQQALAALKSMLFDLKEKLKAS